MAHHDTIPDPTYAFLSWPKNTEKLFLQLTPMWNITISSSENLFHIYLLGNVALFSNTGKKSSVLCITTHEEDEQLLFQGKSRRSGLKLPVTLNITLLTEEVGNVM